MRSNVVLNSPRLKELKRKKRKATKRRLVYYLIFAVVVFFALGLASRIPALRITKIDISGNKIIESKEIEKIIQKNIAENYFYLFPKSNFLIYPENKIKNELSSEFKRIKNITIGNKNIDTLKVEIGEYGGKYLWCGNAIPELNDSNNQKCYFIDDTGYIFDEAPYFSGDVYFKFYGNEGLATENPSGSYFLKNKFAKIIEFKNAIEKMDIKLGSFWLQNDQVHKDEGNFYLSNTPTPHPVINFKIDGDYKKLAQNLESAIAVEPFHSDLAKKLSSLLYIDLRFDNKVYYKFK